MHLLFCGVLLPEFVLIQILQFSIRIVFDYTQLNVKTVLFQRIQFSVNTVSLSKIGLFQTIQFSMQKTVPSNNSV